MASYNAIEDLLYLKLKYEAKKEEFYEKYYYDLEEFEDLKHDLECVKCDYENLENNYIELIDKYEKLKKAYIELRDKNINK